MHLNSSLHFVFYLGLIAKECMMLLKAGFHIEDCFKLPPLIPGVFDFVLGPLEWDGSERCGKSKLKFLGQNKLSILVIFESFVHIFVT